METIHAHYGNNKGVLRDGTIKTSSGRVCHSIAEFTMANGGREVDFSCGSHMFLWNDVNDKSTRGREKLLAIEHNIRSTIKSLRGEQLRVPTREPVFTNTFTTPTMYSVREQHKQSRHQNIGDITNSTTFSSNPFSGTGQTFKFENKNVSSTLEKPFSFTAKSTPPPIAGEGNFEHPISSEDHSQNNIKKQTEELKEREKQILIKESELKKREEELLQKEKEILDRERQILIKEENTNNRDSLSRRREVELDDRESKMNEYKSIIDGAIAALNKSSVDFQWNNQIVEHDASNEEETDIVHVINVEDNLVEDPESEITNEVEQPDEKRWCSIM
ncbi:SCAMP1 [Acrasis kona]|uniref:SCAMP1 n=1 Tax=Acrasis kona TaxID=1008807 RepID=A0AAW2Z8G9_9EUKA